jgi:hypothetical protein
MDRFLDRLQNLSLILAWPAKALHQSKNSSKIGDDYS